MEDNNKIIELSEENSAPKPDKIISNLEFEFNELLNRLNADDYEDPKTSISQNELDFLKNDYIDLYDIRKILKAPKYHLAKFKIRFLDFINLTDFFYKTFDKDFDTEEKETIKKGDLKDHLKKEKKEVKKYEKKEEKKELQKDNAKEEKKESQEENDKEEKQEFQKECSKNNKEKENSIGDKKKEPKEEKNTKENIEHSFNSINEKYSFLNDNLSPGDSSIKSENKNVQKSPYSTSHSEISKYNKYTSYSSTNDNLLQIALSDIKAYAEREKTFQFKFKYIKNELGLYENEKISGTVYEEFARKSFKIMLLITSQYNIKVEHPKKFMINDLITYYIKNSKIESFKIKTDIHNIILTNLIDFNMEIDIVSEFKYNIIKELKKNFPKNLFFYEEIYKTGDEKQFDDLTLIVEIARNIIIQGKEKLSQIIKYIEFISILNLYKDKITANFSEPLSSIYKHCNINSCTSKMFCIITDGNYSFLKYVFNEIIQKIFKNQITNIYEIKKFINEQITKLDARFEEKETTSIEENIFNNYLMIDKLKKNNIKFCVLYIGDMNQSLYQQELINSIITNEKLIELNDNNNFADYFRIKSGLSKIKEMNRNLKNIISSFIQEIDSMTNKKLSDMELESLIDDCIKGLDFSKFNKIKNEFKFDIFIKIFCKDDDIEFLKKIEEIKNKKKYINFKISEIKSFKNGYVFINDYLDKLNSFTGQKLFEVYIIKIKDNEEDNEENNLYNILGKINTNNFRNNNVRYLIYSKDGKK